MMENYKAKYISDSLKLTNSRDVTEEAHYLFVDAHAKSQTEPFQMWKKGFEAPKRRSIDLSSLLNQGDRPPKPRSMTSIQMSKSGPDLDLSALNQLVQTSQTRLIAEALYFLNSEGGEGELRETIENVIEEWEEGMLTGDGGEEGWLAAVRAIDLGMAINRIRGLKVV